MITVFGSLNVDLVFGLDRLPTRGETVLTREIVRFPGGKGANQAAAAAKSGAVTRFVGCVGTDGQGEPVLEALRGAGCDVSGVVAVPGATGTAVVMVERSGENQIVVGSGANMSVTAELLEAAPLAGGDTLVCQMEIPVEATVRALAVAKARGARTVLNLAPAQPIAPEALATVDVLIVNEGEAALIAGGGARPEATARALARAHDLICVVTLGADGAVAATPQGQGWNVGTLAVEAVDTVGAGDAFVGILAASLDRGLDLADGMHRASVAAGLACSRPGAMSAMPTRPEIEDRLSALPRPTELGDG